MAEGAARCRLAGWFAFCWLAGLCHVEVCLATSPDVQQAEVAGLPYAGTGRARAAGATDPAAAARAAVSFSVAKQVLSPSPTNQTNPPPLMITMGWMSCPPPLITYSW